MPTVPEGTPVLDGPAARRPATLPAPGALGDPEQTELRAVLRLALTVTGASRAALNLADGGQQVTLSTPGGERWCSSEVEFLCARAASRPGVSWSRDLHADPDLAGSPPTAGGRSPHVSTPGRRCGQRGTR